MSDFWHSAQVSLVFFTLFTQAAVGAFCVILVNDFIKRKAPDAIYDAFTRISTYLLVPLTGLGLIFSTLHLGRPVFAWRALAHIERSPLSREVWSFGLFFALAALYTFLWYRRTRDTELRRLVGVITGAVGLFAVYTQAQVYRIPGRPQWDHLSTDTLFLLSALLLGPLFVATVFNLVWGRLVPLEQGDPVIRRSHRRLGITLAAVTLLQAAVLWWRYDYLADGAAAAHGPAVLGLALTGGQTRASALALAETVLHGPYGWMLSAQLTLSVALPLLLAVGLWWWHGRKGDLRVAGVVIVLTAAFAAVGEFLGRSLFYLTGVPWF